MTSFQKGIKYAAIVFGIFICINIFAVIFGVFTALFGVAGFFGNRTTVTTQEVNEARMDFSETYDGVTELKLDLDLSSLEIRKSDQYKVEAYQITTDFESKKEGSTLVVKDHGNKKINWGNHKIVSKVIIYLPEQELDKLYIETGIGEATIEKIQTKKLELIMGVGTIQIQEIEADKAKISGGAGKTVIENAIFHDLDLDCGVGNMEIRGHLYGKSDIDCGVGRFQLQLLGQKGEYKIKAKTGIGRLAINDIQVKDDSVYGTGSNEIEINGGVGNTEINLVEDPTKEF